FLDRAWIERDERIEADNGMTGLEQMFAKMRADKSGGASNKTFHARILPRVARTVPSLGRMGIRLGQTGSDGECNTTSQGRQRCSSPSPLAAWCLPLTGPPQPPILHLHRALSSVG